MTELFSTSIAIKQDYYKGPTLFNVFINDIVNGHKTVDVDPVNINKKIECPIYADDILLMLESPKAVNGH